MSLINKSDEVIRQARADKTVVNDLLSQFKAVSKLGGINDSGGAI